MNSSSRRINYLGRINSAKSYLEIGVRSGETFFSVDIENRFAVDPEIRTQIDVSRFTDGRDHVYETTSDRFFSVIGAEVKFDIIFIDGLHTFEQCLRDLICAIRCSHKETFIVIDDILPIDVFASLPEPTRANRFRSMSGNSQLAWQGDVYKVMFMMCDFFPYLSYRTITSDGPAQAVCAFKYRENFRAGINDIEKISRLSYFDMMDRLEVFNCFSETEVFEWASAVLDT